MTRLRVQALRFQADDGGNASIWSIFWTLIFLLVGALAIDVTNAFRFKQSLTATADATALGALMSYREVGYYGLFTQNDSSFYTENDFNDAQRYDRAQEVAVALSQAIMGDSRNGNVVTDAEVELGVWSGGTFVPWVEGSPPPDTVNAARVVALRSNNRLDPSEDNPVNTLLLGALGAIGVFDLGATAVAESFVPGCLATRDGIFATGRVTISDSNIFSGDLCIHGEGESVTGNPTGVGITAGSGLLFGSNVIVSAPGDQATMVDGPGAADPVSGINFVYRNQTITPSGIREFDTIYTMMRDPLTADPGNLIRFMPQRIFEVVVDGNLGVPTVGDGDPNTPLPDGTLTVPVVTDLTDPNDIWPLVDITAADFHQLIDDTVALPVPDMAGAFGDKIFNITCDASTPVVNFDEAETFANMVVVSSNCLYSFSNSVQMEASVLITNADPSGTVVFGADGVTLGNTSCAAGSGTKLMARGGIDFSSNITAIRSQIVSRNGDIAYGSKIDGTNGTSVHAGRNITLTSHSEPEVCTGAGTDNLIVSREYYRLVR